NQNVPRYRNASLIGVCRHHPDPGSVQFVVSCLFTVVGSFFLLFLMSGSVGPGRTGNGRCFSAVLLLLLMGFTASVWAVSEPGKWTVDIDSVSFLSKLLAKSY
ncbi:hypothetical protein XENOCAPTIV_027027, partial [Xenoophorus captivus]